MQARHPAGRDPVEAEIALLVAARAPGGFVFFLVCLLISTLFEIARFPERRGWMLGFVAVSLLLVGVCHTLIRRRPADAATVMVVFVNVIGVGLNAYHVVVGGSVAMCLWTLTGLLGGAAVFLPWGGRYEAVASLGALLSYPLHLEVGGADGLAWAAGGSYLLCVVSLAVFGAARTTRSLRDELRLANALSEREARLQSYFDLALVGTAILGPAGSCREVNDELCRLLAYERAELIGTRWATLVPPDDADAASAQLAGALRGEAPRHVRETSLLRKDGRALPVTVGMRGLPGASTDPVTVMVVVQDITERRHIEAQRERLLEREAAARQEAETASRAKDAFLAMISHELRTPLSPILAWADLLRRPRPEPQQLERGLAAIQRNAAIQAQLIDDLLDVSRISAGKLHLAVRPTDLPAVVRDAIDVVRPAAQAKGVAVECAVEADGTRVLADPDRLRQVFWNLLSNAVKFTPAGGTVRVELFRAFEHVRVAVRDTGRGIAPELLPHVFERFRQGDTAARPHGGLGLGLAIARELVDLHGGRVWAESPGESGGAVFTVELPLLATGARAGERERRGEPLAVLAGLRVLVVDDDVDSNEAVRALLASCGADVRTAGSTRQALEIAGRWRPDVLVSDLAMPEEDGFRLLTRVREQRGRLGSVPAIALTALVTRADRQRALQAGFRAHIAKPVHTPELVTAVATLAREAPGRG